jgi:hypothetical protein
MIVLSTLRRKPMDNMNVWGQFKDTPKEAQKEITAGRLKGFTDINPMWRFKRLTEVFGPCGIGWKYTIQNAQIVPGANDEMAAFVDILLYYVDPTSGKWSEGVPGFGGSMFVAKESKGMHTSDECFKMALSDAIGTACKALGMSADIYFSKDRSKYTGGQDDSEPKMETWEDAAGFILEFGKHKGKTLSEVWQIDIDYIRWLKDGEKTDPIIKKAISLFDKHLRERRA